jgi:hypothetical protein
METTGNQTKPLSGSQPVNRVAVILIFVFAPLEMNVILMGIALFSSFFVWNFFLKV